MQYIPVDAAWIRPLIIFLALSIRYFVIAGLAFLVFYVFRPDYTKLYKKIQQRFAKVSDYRREIAYSMSTFVIFASIGFLIRLSPLAEHIKIYKDISEHGWLYFFSSIVAMIFIHDTYFYWTHRLMHHPTIYPFVHKTHHLSVNPSPWASFSFHPLEAVVEFGIIFIFLFLFPVHVFAILTFSMFMMLENVMGHVGYEILPKGWNKSLLTKWINTSTNHNMHHQYFKGNYGLYFTIWDRLMGTLHPKYEARYEEVAGMEKPDNEAEVNGLIHLQTDLKKG
jgi:sterol desaturase/sphingolipid hydroxylase (fatty acid hydroxylase superfamily)